MNFNDFLFNVTDVLKKMFLPVKYICKHIAIDLQRAVSNYDKNEEVEAENSTHVNDKYYVYIKAIDNTRTTLDLLVALSNELKKSIDVRGRIKLSEYPLYFNSAHKFANYIYNTCYVSFSNKLSPLSYYSHFVIELERLD